ncbi:MAG: hypothetical protein KIS85_02400 [Anaerolineales bacterium]|nr:hypothetical protein [Anaerolineales bacterium]
MSRKASLAWMDWLTVFAIAAVAISLNVFFHESVHAVTCVALGGDLRELTALHVDCDPGGDWQTQVVAGSAAIANLALGLVCWRWLPRAAGAAQRFFLWLFMLMNWLYGAGYLMFSGVANIGDWAVVIAGWEPHWLWRVLMALVGTGLFIWAVWTALQELGKYIGGREPELIGRAVKLGLVAYLASAVVVLLAGWFNPYGLLGQPAVAGFIAVLGALSPLLWMMQWFRSGAFAKLAGPALQIPRSWGWIALGGLAIVVYAVVLGSGLRF